MRVARHPKLAWMALAASTACLACHASSHASIDAPRDAGARAALAKPSESAASSLYPGPGAVAYLQVLARGTQNYTCVLTDGGAAWGPAAPEAILYLDGGAVGRHFGGPTWEWTADRSTFVGSKLAADGFVSLPSPDDAGVNVPWLVLGKKAGTDAGMLGPAIFVQRLKTEGGVATNQPSLCDGAAADGGRTVKVPYRATYVFYRSAAGAN